MLEYSIIHFIEINLLLHAQDSARLRAARLDALTGVYGRGAIEEELKRSMNSAREANTPVSILVTDIDHFKSVNDMHGHTTGDDVLRAVAKCLRRNVGRIGGVMGRWGARSSVARHLTHRRPDGGRAATPRGQRGFAGWPADHRQLWRGGLPRD